MRKSVVLSVVLHTLAGAAGLLWLLWYFVPVGNVIKGLATLAVIIAAGWLIWKSRRDRSGSHGALLSGNDIPLLDTQGPVVLVCGEGLDEIFHGQQLRKTAHGWWLRVSEIGALGDIVRHIQMQQPRQTGQLSVMYVCQADKHQDEAVLRAQIKALRQQIKQLSALTGFSLPLVLGTEFSGPETPWVIVRGDKPVVCPEGSSPVAFIDWQQTKDHLLAQPVLSQAFTFVRETLLDELTKADRLCPPVYPFAVALRTGSVRAQSASVWGQWLYRRVCLHLSQTLHDNSVSGRFPDALLPLLSPFAAPTQGGQRTRRVVLLFWLCALSALGFSASNNDTLIRDVGADLQRWYAIPMTHYAPKAESLASLKQKALLLERWQRQGEPMRYSLGYYPGQRLWLALQQAIDTYIPPPPPPPRYVPKIIRLDSMSLFDVGKWALKPGSTKLLVNSLVGIKAKPGWLIVVTGHTDNTGNDRSNQILSLKRAEAVRDWMRDTGDVAESCFAVQGFGESKPLKTNDTEAGRAANRRVEISLVPQADACQAKGATASPATDGVHPQKMEK